MDARIMARDVHVASLVVDDGHLVAALLSSLYKSLCRVQVSIGRQNSDFHF
jgi:hypothetical protein